jgi:multidrug efflux pump subunit AcrA (membrane-fusion protein)
VKVGQIATIRFSTVNPHGRTTFDGQVVTLSPGRITGPNGQGYYRAQIKLVDPAALREANVALQPGIPASVNIRTQERTIFDYIFAPLSDAVSRSFRQE